MATSPLGNRATSILDILGKAFGMNDEEEKKAMQPPMMSPALAPSAPIGNILADKAMSDRMGGQVSPAEISDARLQQSPMPMQGPQTVKMPNIGTKETELKAADAAVRQMASGGDQDPGFMDKVKNYFGDEGNMLRLAMAFNTMRLEPDQQLAAYIGKRLETLDKNKLAAGGARSIAQQLYKMGYKDYAEQVLRNPSMAQMIYEQVVQKDLAPGAADTVSGVQYDKDGRAYIVRTPKAGGKPTVEYLGTSRTSDVDKASLESQALREKGNWELSIKKSEEAMNKADNARGMVDQYQIALDAAMEAQARGDDVGGILKSRLPSFNEQTAAFRSAANTLGIGVINSATFGALSEKELQLAMSTAIDQNLSGQDLVNHIKAKKAATQKLYYAMLEEAQLMATMPYNEYIQNRAEREKENRKYMNMEAPKGTEDLWKVMSPAERKAFIEAGNQ